MAGDPDNNEGAVSDFLSTLEPAKERKPIVWTGKAKEPASSSKAAEPTEAVEKQPAPEPKPLQRMKPNAAFLLNVVADAQRGNERLCADEATNASLTVLGQAVSAGIRPHLERTLEAGGNAQRTAVLSVAQQQKLAACTALLKEVAMVHGFALHIDSEVCEAAAGAKTGSGAAPEPREGYVQPLHVRLNVASKGDRAALEDAVTVSHAPALREAEPKNVARAPAIDVRANRLAGNAFGAIGLPGTPQPPPLAVRKLQRSKAQQRDRTGVFASSDATPAESSQGGEESAGVVDAEAAEDEENSSKQSGRFSERAERGSKSKRPFSCTPDNDHPSQSSGALEASEDLGEPVLAAQRLPQTRAGMSRKPPTGQLGRMRSDRRDKPDEEEELKDGRQEPARKRLRSSVIGNATAQARALNGAAPRPSGGLRSAPSASEDGDEADHDEALDDEPPPHQQPKQPMSNGVHARGASADSQAADLWSRLSKGARAEAADRVRTANGREEAGLRGTQGGARRGVKSGRGLFGTALTGLQR